MVSCRQWEFIIFHFWLPNDSSFLIPLFKEDFESGTSILGNLWYSEVGWKAYIQSSDWKQIDIKITNRACKTEIGLKPLYLLHIIMVFKKCSELKKNPTHPTQRNSPFSLEGNEKNCRVCVLSLFQCPKSLHFIHYSFNLASKKEVSLWEAVFRAPLRNCRAQHYKLHLKSQLHRSLLEFRHSEVDNKVGILWYMLLKCIHVNLQRVFPKPHLGWKLWF